VNNSPGEQKKCLEDRSERLELLRTRKGLKGLRWGTCSCPPSLRGRTPGAEDLKTRRDITSREGSPSRRSTGRKDGNCPLWKRRDGKFKRP